MRSHHRFQGQRHGLLVAAVALALTACGGGTDPQTIRANAIEPGTTCALDGMLLADYAGPKAQIHYAGVAEPDWFCDTIEMFSVLQNPEQARRLSAVYVQDMGQADWNHPSGHWIDARTAVYVFGSKRHGSMGPTAAAFATEADAKRFIEANGGRLFRFDTVTPEMVVLDGGAQHDKGM